MQISKSSWHYRFTDTFISSFAGKCKRGQHTTCSYIRAFIYAVISAITCTAFFGGLATAALFIVASMISVPVMIFFLPLVHIPEVMLVMATMAWIMTGVGLGVYLISLLAKYGSEWSEKRHTLMIQAMQDKKDGICTIVRIVD
jgi:cellulose synthase/poly-beta-1,6-N-acetylglucosamine synthase-like glycosyltransferase